MLWQASGYDLRLRVSESIDDAFGARSVPPQRLHDDLLCYGLPRRIVLTPSETAREMEPAWFPLLPLILLVLFLSFFDLHETKGLEIESSEALPTQGSASSGELELKTGSFKMQEGLTQFSERSLVVHTNFLATRILLVLVMDASVPCGKLISEDFCVTAFVNNCRSDLEESYLKHELGASNNAEETAEVLPGKDADNALIISKENLGVEELGTAFDGVLHIRDIQQGVSSHVLKAGVEELGTAVDGALGNQEGASGHILESGVGEIHHQKVQSMLQELKTDSVTAVTTKVEKSFSKCATFPSKENTLLSPVPVDARAELTCTAPAGQSFQKSQNAAYSRSFSMPVSSLVLPIANAVTSPDVVLT
ncbi:hypothetical protein ACLOJK_001705 [Asimina triloba]